MSRRILYRWLTKVPLSTSFKLLVRDTLSNKEARQFSKGLERLLITQYRYCICISSKGYATSGASIAFSCINPAIGLAMTLSGGVANSVTKHVVNVQTDRLHDTVMKSLQRDEEMYGRLIGQLAILKKHPLLCFLHHRNETVEAFFLAFGQKSMENAKYWSLRNDPEEKTPILINEMARRALDDNAGQQMVEVVLDNGGELVSKLLSEYTSRNVQEFVKVVLPPMKEVMKELMASTAVRIAVANAGVAMVTEATMNAGTAECVAEIGKQSLVGKAAKILKTFGCNVQISSNGALQHLTIDPGHNLSGKVVETLNKGIKEKLFTLFTGPDNQVRKVELVCLDDISHITCNTSHIMIFF